MKDSQKYEIFSELFSYTKKVLFIYNVSLEKFELLNNSFSLVWGQAKEAIIDNPALLLATLHPEDKEYLVKEFQELLAGVPKKYIEFRIIVPGNNLIRWICLTPLLVEDKNGSKLIGGHADNITVMKDNILNLEKFAAKKNSVLEILSHDLAGPLSSIKALADFLSESTKELENKRVEKVISIIQRSSERSIQLIRDFMEQEFLEFSKSGMVKRRVELVEKINELIEQYQEAEDLINKKISLTASSKKIYILLDFGKFMQVINNLISNAIKFTHDDGLISIELRELDENVLIVVRDNGIGIPKEYHSTLFDKFTSARRIGLRGEPTTGLGMCIIKTIIEWHEGKIWFESEENKGTAFYIELPKE